MSQFYIHLLIVQQFISRCLMRNGRLSFPAPGSQAGAEAPNSWWPGTLWHRAPPAARSRPGVRTSPARRWRPGAHLPGGQRTWEKHRANHGKNMGKNRSLLLLFGGQEMRRGVLDEEIWGYKIKVYETCWDKASQPPTDSRMRPPSWPVYLRSCSRVKSNCSGQGAQGFAVSLRLQMGWNPQCFKMFKKCQEREPMKHPYGGLLHK